MGKKPTIFWSVRIEADLYEWLQEITRKVPGKPFLTAQYVANEALREYRKKLTHALRADGQTRTSWPTRTRL